MDLYILRHADAVDRAPSEQWPYHAVAAAIRAHSLIRSFPEVDAERTGVTGISWGGYLTCIVAGVDARFKVAIPVYGCGFLHENSAWVGRLEKMTTDQRSRWIKFWDPSRYVQNASMPMLFVNGTNDFAYPLDSYMKTYALPKGPKQLRITVNMPHGHQAGWAPQEIAIFADQHLRNGTALPILSPATVIKDGMTAHITNNVPIRSASLHSTTEDGPINKRKWNRSRDSGRSLPCSRPIRWSDGISNPGSFPIARPTRLVCSSIRRCSRGF